MESPGNHPTSSHPTRTGTGDTSSSTLSRRGLLGGLAAAAVAGWSAADGRWATPAEASTGKVAALPPLDGTLETAAEVTAGFGHDFGGYITGTPWAVLRPGSVQDIVEMVRYARANGLTIAVNGRGGTAPDLESHSNYGQAEVPGGIAVDARSLSAVHSVDSGGALVDAGATLADVLDVALPQGLTLPSLPDYMHLSVGGLLSVGGIGDRVQKYGMVIDNVEWIEVVTGEGSLLTASPTVHPELFAAVLGGGGQFGIITRAKLRLVQAPKRAVTFALFYDDLGDYLADQEMLLADGRFDAVAGQVVRKADDSGWRYALGPTAYYDDTPPDRDKLLTGLSDNRSEAQIQDLSYHDLLYRLDPVIVQLKAAGFWAQRKPWASFLVPASKAQEFMTATAAELTQADLGAGFLLWYPFPTARLTRPLAVKPAEPTAYLFDLLCFPAPDDTDTAGMLVRNRRLYDRVVQAGGKRYLIGAIPDMTQADWQRHYGPLWCLLGAAKRSYDPDNVLTPGQGIFP